MSTHGWILWYLFLLRVFRTKRVKQLLSEQSVLLERSQVERNRKRFFHRSEQYFFSRMSTPENYTNSNFFSWIESCVVKYLSKYAIRIRMSRKSKVKHLLDDTDSHAYNDTTKPRKKLLLTRICCLELWCCLAISATHVSNQHTLKTWDIFTSITTNFENRMAPTKKNTNKCDTGQGS